MLWFALVSENETSRRRHPKRTGCLRTDAWPWFEAGLEGGHERRRGWQGGGRVHVFQCTSICGVSLPRVAPSSASSRNRTTIAPSVGRRSWRSNPSWPCVTGPNRRPYCECVRAALVLFAPFHYRSTWLLGAPAPSAAVMIRLCFCCDLVPFSAGGRPVRAQNDRGICLCACTVLWLTQ
jgi:hypothetical protein